MFSGKKTQSTLMTLAPISWFTAFEAGLLHLTLIKKWSADNFATTGD